MGTWRPLGASFHIAALSLQAGTTPGWLEMFTSCNESLEAIHKSLSDHLETKRLLFPRFYFLSNEELVRLLITTSAPTIWHQLGECLVLCSVPLTNVSLAAASQRALAGALQCLPDSPCTTRNGS